MKIIVQFLLFITLSIGLFSFNNTSFDRVNNIEKIKSYNPDTSLNIHFPFHCKFESVKQTPYFYYAYYTLQINDINVYASRVIVIWDKNFKKVKQIQDIPSLSYKNIISIITKEEDKKPTYFFNISNLNYTPVWITYKKINEEWFESMVDYNTGVLISQKSIEQNFTKDSLFHATVYVLDPLTIAKKYYNDGVIKDWNDSSYFKIENQKFNASFELKYDTDSLKFIGISPYVKLFDEDGSPFDSSFRFSSNQNTFTRNQYYFEDAMCFYHISNWQKQMQNLGYDSILRQGIFIDPHGQYGDNSKFVPSTNKDSCILNFGIGGVDDAEDPDVIIHEYTHGMIYDITNMLSSEFTTERKGLDEGIADYFATAYSYRIDTFRWSEMFTWDGHNEFWNGRTANITRTYKDTPISNIYTFGSIWNDATSHCFNSIGVDTMNLLMLESLHWLTLTTTLAQHAKTIMYLDTLLFGARHCDVLCQNFYRKKILNQCSLDTSIAKPNENFKLLNSFGFASNDESLTIEFGIELPKIEIKIINMLGQIVDYKVVEKQSSVLYSNDLPIGIYGIEIQTPSNKYTSIISKIK